MSSLVSAYADTPSDRLREEFARYMMADGYATGHGDTLEDLVIEFLPQALKRLMSAPTASPEGGTTGRLMTKNINLSNTIPKSGENT